MLSQLLGDGGGELLNSFAASSGGPLLQVHCLAAKAPCSIPDGNSEVCLTLASLVLNTGLGGTSADSENTHCFRSYD